MFSQAVGQILLKLISTLRSIASVFCGITARDTGRRGREKENEGDREMGERESVLEY